MTHFVLAYSPNGGNVPMLLPLPRGASSDIELPRIWRSSLLYHALLGNLRLSSVAQLRFRNQIRLHENDGRLDAHDWRGPVRRRKRNEACNEDRKKHQALLKIIERKLDEDDAATNSNLA